MHKASKNDKHHSLAVIEGEKARQGDPVLLTDGRTVRYIERVLYYDREADESTVLLRPAARWMLTREYTAWARGTPPELCEIFPPFRNINEWTKEAVELSLVNNINTSISVIEPSVRIIDGLFDKLLHIGVPANGEQDWTLVVAFYPNREREGF